MVSPYRMETYDMDEKTQNLLEIPWFLDHRLTNPRREEFLALQAELKEKAKSSPKFTEPQIQASLESPWRKKQMDKQDKRDRKLLSRRIILDAYRAADKSGDPESLVSGRVLKSTFMNAVEEWTVKETDYERGIRLLLKDGSLRKHGRSYKKGRRYAK